MCLRKMSLDIHTGKSKVNAEKIHPALSFDESIHELFFLHEKKLICKYPLFLKMQDYYQDAYYPNGEIESLMSEIDKLRQEMKDKDSCTFLEKFIELCNMALLRKDNIYCFSD